MRGYNYGIPKVNKTEIIWSWLGAFLGISTLIWTNKIFLSGTDLTLVIGSFGASVVLIYGAIQSPLAQPRNLIGGHIISALVGVACYKLFYTVPWFAAPMAVATAIAIMQLTYTLHPPGGATALIAVIGSEHIHRIGWWYVLAPAAMGAIILLIVALLVNNIPQDRQYPNTWL